MRRRPLLRRSAAGDRRRLEAAAALARGTDLDTLPNPPVGCLLVRPDGSVAGEGFHRGFGLPHAEAEALRAAGAAARGATAFVTLEPCGAAAAGKRTRPCAPALLEAGVARVVYAGEDPGPCAVGAGPALLREGGVAVDRVPCDAAEALLRRWRASAGDPLPWTVAKWAMSLDGKTGDARGGSRWITGEESRARAHALRARCDAVAVGVRTAILDDPDLRPRGVEAPDRAPLRVVVDEGLRLAPGSRLASTAREGAVLVATGARAPAARRARLEAAGVAVEPFPGEGGRVDLRALLLSLRARGVRRLLLEGGGEIQASAFRAGLVRQAAVFVAPALLGGRTAPIPLAGAAGLRTAEDPLRIEEVRVTRWGEDLLVEGFVPVAEAGPER
jgi:diaminohydroxyphosphoribosylaminopyrimidine deaminase/5-amino-6-(5-phosphoribosylamino)uracil reductase